MPNLPFRSLAALAAMLAAVALPAHAQYGGDAPVTFFDAPGFSGQSLPVNRPVSSMSSARFNDKASSVRIRSGTWEVCSDGNFRGRCEIVSRDIGDLRSIGLNNNISSIRPAQARQDVNTRAPIILYSRTGFSGDARSLDRSTNRLGQVNFNDKARSVRINSGVWQLCTDANGGGRCEYVDRNVRNLSDLGLAGNISSAVLTPYREGPNGHAISLFDKRDYRGAFLGFDEAVSELSSRRFNDTAESIRINSGRWLVCSDANFRGHCEVLGRSVRDLYEFELGNKISSLRPYDGRSYDGGYPGGGNNGGGHGGDGHGGGDQGNDRGIDGETTTFFPRPTDYGRRIDYRHNAGDTFCRARGFRDAVYAGRNRRNELSDVLCRR
ncbi:MAG: beta/gamma crystallin-related protein [Hyphomonadaceae bacterium]